MTIKEQCKFDEHGNVNFSKYFENNLAYMLKLLAKKRNKEK